MTQQFYFKINLNKFGEMKIQQEKEKKTFIQALLFFGIGTIILFAGVLYLDSILAEKVLNRQNFLDETEKQIASYEKSTDFLSSSDLDLLAKTFNDRIFWAKKLVALSQEIDNKMAITQFSYKNGVLSLYGVTSIEVNQREFDLIDGFITKLKQNEQISVDFPDIKYSRATRDKVKDTDILRFQIDCFNKDFNASRGGAR
jgi:Tfp pilus assembly protein PilN